MRFEKHITIHATGNKAVDVLTDETDLTRQHIKQVMNKGAVWLTRNNSTQRIRRADRQVMAADQLHLYYDEKVLAEKPQDAQLIADEAEYSVLYKPFGMLSQGSKWGDHCTVYRWAEQHLTPQRPAFIVHRLDRSAAGLMLIAHKKKVASQLSSLFEQRLISKKYQAIVHGKFPATMLLDAAIDGKQAVSHASVIDYNLETDRSLLEVTIETGRKHQIRRHLAEAGFPIVGDRLYGRAATGDEDLKLLSCLISFKSPLDQQVKQYLLPEKMQLSLQS